MLIINELRGVVYRYRLIVPCVIWCGFKPIRGIGGNFAVWDYSAIGGNFFMGSNRSWWSAGRSIRPPSPPRTIV